MKELHVVHFMRRPYPGAFSLERVFEEIRAKMPSDIKIRIVQNQFFSSGFFKRLADAWRARRLAGDVNHITGDTHYLVYFLPRNSTILTIHDCEMVNRASGLKKWLLNLLWIRLPVFRAGRVITISERTRQDVIRLTGGSGNKVDVIENPVPASFQPSPMFKNPTAIDTILHIGTKENKNLERLVDSIKKMPVKLLVVGRLKESQKLLLESSGLDFEVRFDLDDEELHRCYQEASVVAFVSLNEGFGLPILEAQAIGRPVVTSNREPMLSVAGHGAYFVDPESKSSIEEGVRHLVEDDSLCEEIVKYGFENVARYSSDSIAHRYASLYRIMAVN
ncbi:glycosyltransferase [Halomonas sp. 18H]|nr:glycosyltransferase [Halomonas sp. 18H]MCW4153902.1 glycosyltransferase [Halomonas sp. 18H]